MDCQRVFIQDISKQFRSIYLKNNEKDMFNSVSGNIGTAFCLMTSKKNLEFDEGLLQSRKTFNYFSPQLSVVGLTQNGYIDGIQGSGVIMALKSITDRVYECDKVKVFLTTILICYTDTVKVQSLSHYSQIY